MERVDLLIATMNLKDNRIFVIHTMFLRLRMYLYVRICMVRSRTASLLSAFLEKIYKFV